MIITVGERMRAMMTMLVLSFFAARIIFLDAFIECERYVLVCRSTLEETGGT